MPFLSIGEQALPGNTNMHHRLPNAVIPEVTVIDVRQGK